MLCGLIGTYHYVTARIPTSRAEMGCTWIRASWNATKLQTRCLIIIHILRKCAKRTSEGRFQVQNKSKRDMMKSVKSPKRYVQAWLPFRGTTYYTTNICHEWWIWIRLGLQYRYCGVRECTHQTFNVFHCEIGREFQSRFNSKRARKTNLLRCVEHIRMDGTRAHQNTLHFIQFNSFSRGFREMKII